MLAARRHGECMWFSQPDANWTLNPATGRPDDPIARIPGEPTLNAPELRTYNINVSSGPLDYTRTSPWRAPGSAPVYGSGCGVGAGGPLREQDGGTGREFGVTQNLDGKDLPALNTAPHRWQRGSVVEVGWAATAVGSPTAHRSPHAASHPSSAYRRTTVAATRIGSAARLATSPKPASCVDTCLLSGTRSGFRRSRWAAHLPITRGSRSRASLSPRGRRPRARSG